jgi:hypothetical protein
MNAYIRQYVPYVTVRTAVGQPFHQRYGHSLRAGDPWHILLDRTRRTYCGARLRRTAWIDTTCPPGVCGPCGRRSM